MLKGACASTTPRRSKHNIKCLVAGLSGERCRLKNAYKRSQTRSTNRQPILMYFCNAQNNMNFLSAQLSPTSNVVHLRASKCCIMRGGRTHASSQQQPVSYYETLNTISALALAARINRRIGLSRDSRPKCVQRPQKTKLQRCQVHMCFFSLT